MRLFWACVDSSLRLLRSRWTNLKWLNYGRVYSIVRLFSLSTLLQLLTRNGGNARLLDVGQTPCSAGTICKPRRASAGYSNSRCLFRFPTWLLGGYRPRMVGSRLHPVSMAKAWKGPHKFDSKRAFRIDKYYMLVRKFVNASFHLLVREEWLLAICEEYNSIIGGPGGPL